MKNLLSESAGRSLDWSNQQRPLRRKRQQQQVGLSFRKLPIESAVLLPTCATSREKIWLVCFDYDIQNFPRFYLEGLLLSKLCLWPASLMDMQYIYHGYREECIWHVRLCESVNNCLSCVYTLIFRVSTSEDLSSHLVTASLPPPPLSRPCPKHLCQLCFCCPHHSGRAPPQSTSLIVSYTLSCSGGGLFTVHCAQKDWKRHTHLNFPCTWHRSAAENVHTHRPCTLAS